MNDLVEQPFAADIQDIQSLEIVPAILELVCSTTGMRFAAVARVTETRWIACAVKDEINFGLQPGGELEIATTICNEIRGHGQAVVIDEVAADADYCQHHTPKLYGIQSYISIPIFLKNGQFFGTLCAIDPRPNPLKAGKALSMMNLFADLIAFHLHAKDQLRAQYGLLEATQHQLETSLDDIRQFSHIGRHVLQEPLRKLQVFSDMIVNDTSLPNDHRVKGIAGKINGIAKDFSTIVQELTEYAVQSDGGDSFEVVDLNDVIQHVLSKLQLQIRERNAAVDIQPLHHIRGIANQLNRVFYHVLDNALQYARPGVKPLIRIASTDIGKAELSALGFDAVHEAYCKISFQDNGIGIKAAHLDKIFDLFVRLHSKDAYMGLGVGLSQAKKIMVQHHGLILVSSREGEGSTFSLVFPIDRR